MNHKRYLAITSAAFLNVAGAHHEQLKELCSAHQLSIVDSIGPQLEEEFASFLSEFQPYCGIFGGDAWTPATVGVFARYGGKHIVNCGVEYYQADITAMQSYGISYSGSTRGRERRSEAERALWLIYDGLRHIAEQRQSGQHLAPSPCIGLDLRGSNVLMIGNCIDVQCLASALVALGVSVSIYDAFIDRNGHKYMTRLNELAERSSMRSGNKVELVEDMKLALRTADIITLHASPEQHWRLDMDRSRFDMTKRGVGILNTAHADSVDVGVVAEFLETKRVSFYATAVPRYKWGQLIVGPLLNLPGFFMTDGSPQMTRQSVELECLEAVEMLRRALEGELTR